MKAWRAPVLGLLAAVLAACGGTIYYGGSSSSASHSLGYSLGAVDGQSVYVVQSDFGSGPGEAARNVLLQSNDGGRTWTNRLHFGWTYEGMQAFGPDGFMWAIDEQPHDCKLYQGGSFGCATPPSFAFKLYGTVDDGASWIARPVPDFPVEDAFFLDASRGWAVSSPAMSSSPQTGLGAEVLYQTADGGSSWTRVGSLPKSLPMGRLTGFGNHPVTFSRLSDGSLRGWYIGATQLYVSMDAGRSWQPVAISVPAWVAGWTIIPTQPAFSGQEGILPFSYRNPASTYQPATENRIYLYISHDGGSSWSDPRPAPAGVALVGNISTSTLDSRHVWLAGVITKPLTGAADLARTSDGGLNWIVVRNTPRIFEMMFGDSTHGYALAMSGRTEPIFGILSTSDGGATWQRVDFPVFPAA